MELSFVLVLTLVTLVTATPHGYGVKGGASAKAEASAVARAIAPIPLSIPSGAAYSGSFSKSSASSFASSSASSSSSSYSFSGSGANGIAGIGDVGSDQKGCSTGTCPGVAGQSSNGVQQFSGSNAIATAQANALSGSHGSCQGSNCNDSPTEGCSSGDCSKDSDLKDQKDCSTGNCQQKLETPSSETGLPTECSSGQCDKDKQKENFSDSDDFAVNINRNSHSKQNQNHDLSGQYSNKDKPLGPDCSNGKCGPSYPNNLANKQNQQPVPATYLTTPNLNEPCTAPNCNYPSQSNGPQTASLPSSYNVPIQSATNPPNTLYSPSGNTYEPGKHVNPNKENENRPDAPCTSPSCNSGSNIGLGNNQEPSSQIPCLTGRCDIHSSTIAKPSNHGTAYGIISPNYLHGNYPSNTPSDNLGQSGCRTPNCSDLPKNQVNPGSSTEPKYTIPTYSTLPSNLQSNNCGGTGCAGSLTSSPTKLSNTGAPVYSGGFGGPAGILDVTPGSNKFSGHGQPNHYSPTHTPGFIGYSPLEGIKPNEFGSGNHYHPTHSPNTNSPIGTHGSTPIHGSFGIYGPTYTPGNGGTLDNKPSGLPSTLSTQFTPTHGGSFGVPSASNIPLGSVTHPGNIHKPSSTVPTGNVHDFADSTGLSHSNSGSNAIHGSFGVSKPSPTSSVQTSPMYTGGFGGPTGTIDTSGTYKPGSGNCELAGCNGKTDTNVNAGTTSYDKTKPSGDTSSQKKPAYTGGFGGPTGFLKPNEFNVPANIPSTSSGNSPCTNGNCGPKGAPSGSPSHQHSLTGAQSLAAATANANAVAYSGGFGGPPGVLKPYDDGKVNSPAHGNGSGYSPSYDATLGGKNSLPGSSISGANFGALASASASAGATSYNGNENYKNNKGESGGCNSNCRHHASNDGGADIGYPNGFLKNGDAAGSVASAKSVAGANSFGLGGSFASSSASAHASAGAAVKGGYGRK